MHDKAGKADDVGNHDHSRNKRTVVAFPFLPTSSVKHLMNTASAAGVFGRRFENTPVNADMPFQSAGGEPPHLLQMSDRQDQESIARRSSSGGDGGGGEVITHIASHFDVREGDGGKGLESQLEDLATLDQLMDDSLSLQCLTTPGVLILVVVLTCILLAITTMSVCLSIRVKELAQQLEIKQSRQLHESFSIKKSPFVFQVTPGSGTTSTASSSPTSCLFDQETILPVQTLSSKQQRV